MLALVAVLALAPSNQAAAQPGTTAQTQATALEKILSLVSVDEAAHFGLFKSFFELFMQVDRDVALAALRPVLNQFQMPAVHDLLDESAKRIAAIRALEVFNEEIFFRDVYNHFMNVLGITRAELRGPRLKKSMATA